MNIPKSYLMSREDVYKYFDFFFPNRSIYRLIGAYSNKTLKMIKKLHRERISLNRIISIIYYDEYHKYFLVTYKQRHYGRVNTIRLFVHF